MNITWPTGFPNKKGKTFKNIKQSDLWSESEVAETGSWPELWIQTRVSANGLVLGKVVDCKRMSVTAVLSPEQQAERKAGIHIELPRNFKHYLVVRLDTNTVVKWRADIFKRREDQYEGR